MINFRAHASGIFRCVIFLVFCLDSLCSAEENKNIGILLSDDAGNILFEQNAETAYIPASTLKILTSLWAVQTLGTDFRFPTAFALDPVSKNLYIKGFGDPMLVSEAVEKLCQDIIAKTNIRQINDIILDGSYFSSHLHVPGKGRSLNPYDASSGALCVNFNTIAFKWDADTHSFISAEPQTPLLDIFQKEIKKTGLKQGRIILSDKLSMLYPGLLIRHFLEEKKIIISGSVRTVESTRPKMKETMQKPHIFLSPFKLDQVIFKLLKYSNNFIANQLVISLGAKKFQAPGTIEKGTAAFKEFFGHTLKMENLIISEGAGLSRSNRITPKQMLKVLIQFMPCHSLLNRKGNEYYKTGTLSGIRTRAGYIKGKDKRLFPYVIMVNQKNKGYDTIHKRLLKMVMEKTAP